MTQLQIPKSRRLRRVIVAAVIGGLAVVAVAENVVVKSEVQVLSDKNPFAGAVETVPTDTKLEVLAHDGGWVRVRTPAGKEGFISQDDLPANTNLAAVSGSGKTSGADASLAGRGLEEDTAKYAKTKNLKTADAQAMVDWGDAITRDDIRKFGQAGHVGPKKYRE